MSTLEALQTTLAAEHAAVYLYGVLGGRTSQSRAPGLYDAVTAAYTAHRARRDLLGREITNLGAEPVAADPAYELPPRLESPDGIARAALGLERSCATTYAYLVANTETDQRRWAIGALNDAAVRELVFGGTPETFPGASDDLGLTDR